MKLVWILTSYLDVWNTQRPLFDGNAYDKDSFEQYHILRRFSPHYGSQHSLPETLLKEISRRFDHFFLVYTIHALSEHATVHSCPDGMVKFCFREDFSRNAFRTDVQAQNKILSVEPPLSTVSASLLPESVDSADFNIPNFANAAQAKATPPGTASTDTILDAELRIANSRNGVDTNDKKDCADEKWEMELFERVKHDPSVPAYFKTTFGILAANNRDLREERSFLQSRLNL
ncbi:hypothetical protein RB195_006125 [Necator americanus]|uniref:Uncharacterized protein n=1 Tax=Necator americanus TaxID=51031 RepID=A0ABR1BR43_NECAM